MIHELEDRLDQSKRRSGPVRVDLVTTDPKWRSNRDAEPVRADKRKVQFAWLNWERPGAIPSPLNEI